MVNIRPANEGDVNFIYSTWLRCYKHDSPITKFIRRDVFFDKHQALLDRILTKKTTKSVVACDKEDDTVIYGFMVFEPKIMHFVYIKEAFRRMGIGKKLIESQGIDLSKCTASHLTYDLLNLWTAKKTGIEFDPYIEGEK